MCPSPTRVALGALGLLCLAGSLQAQTRARKPAAPPAPPSFKVEIEQAGQPVAIKDHEALLRRAPFLLILTIPDANPVSVDVSFEPGLYEVARTGRPFESAFRSGIGGAEGKANESRDLFISRPSDPLIHSWTCDPGEWRRFEQVEKKGPGCQGRRTVESVFLGGETVPLGKLLRRPLHLVVFRGTLNDKGVEKEAGRDWLKLYLDGAPEAAKTEVKGGFEVVFDAQKPAGDRVAALQALAAAGPETIAALDAVTFEATIRAREAAAVADLRTVLSAEAAYASDNGGFYDGPPCLLDPRKCRPKSTASPFLQLSTLETRNGYKKLFLPGARPSKDEIKKAKASESSLKDFVVVAWPDVFGETGYRAFCADASGRVCSVEGASPPAKDLRCTPECQPLP